MKVLLLLSAAALAVTLLPAMKMTGKSWNRPIALHKMQIDRKGSGRG